MNTNRNIEIITYIGGIVGKVGRGGYPVPKGGGIIPPTS